MEGKCKRSYKDSDGGGLLTFHIYVDNLPSWGRLAGVR